jgi:phosphoglycerol transferase
LAFAIAVAVLLGCSDDQNTAFLASIMAVLALVLAVRDRDWRPLALAGVISIVGFGVLFVNNAPYLVGRLERGPNSMVAQRSLTDQDYYALRPVNLLLPAPGHRVGALSSIAKTSAKAQTTSNESPGTSLGFVGAAGLLWSTGAALAVALGVRARGRSTEFVAQLGVVNLIAILIGMVGGLSFLIALAGFHTYRSWNRVSVYIAFLSLLAVAAGLDRLFGYLRERGRRRHLGTTLVAGTLAVIVLVGVLDQTTPRFIPNYKALAKVFDTDARFYQALENSVPAHSMVFQLPIAPFPEAGTIQKMTDYEEFTAYLQTKTLRWSYGAMRGRIEGDWQNNLNIDDPVGLLAQVAAVGFVGVVIDRNGIAGGASRLLAAVRPYVGPPQIRSLDGNLVYLDLRGLHARLQTELGPNALTQSSQVVIGDTVRWTGFYTPDTICRGSNRWSGARTSSVELDNLSAAPVSVDVSTALVANPAATQIGVRVQGHDDAITLSGGTGSWSRHLVLAPGKTRIQFTLVGPKFVAPGDDRHLYFALNGYSFGGAFDSPVEAWAAQQLPGCKP